MAALVLAVALALLGAGAAAAQIGGEGVKVLVQSPPALAAPTVTPLCVRRVRGTPPDASGGWTMQVRNKNVNVATADKSDPFERDLTLDGTYSISLRWTKGSTTMNTPAVAGACP